MPTKDIPSLPAFSPGEILTALKMNELADDAETEIQGVEDRLEESLSALHTDGVIWRRPGDTVDLIVSAGAGLSVNVTAGEALVGYRLDVAQKADDGGTGGTITNGAVNYCYLMQDGTLFFNVTGVAPTTQRNILLASVTTAGGVVTAVNNYAVGVVRGVGQPSLRAFTVIGIPAVRDAVYVSAANAIEQAISDDLQPAKARVIGLILSRENANTCIIATDGAIVGGFTGLSTGSAYYLQTVAGTVGTGKPTAPDPIVPVGIAVSTTALLVKVFVDEASLGGGGGGAPDPHAASHVVGGGDPLTGNLDSNARIGIRRNAGGTTYQRRRVNLVEGSGIQIGVSDDAASEEVDVSIAATLPVAHAVQHEDGGTDELDLGALAGNLTDAQHGTLATADHSGDLTGNARVGVRKNTGGTTYLRRRVNLIEGANVTLTVAEDAVDEEVDVTIAATGGGGGGALPDLTDVDDLLAHTDGFVLQGDGAQYIGAVLSHTKLGDKGTNTHAQVDTHIADTSIHTEDADLVHVTGPESIAGLKTFATLPQSAAVPTVGDDLVNKTYADAFAQGLTWKSPCRVATTAAGALATDFEDGDTIDGIVIATDDRVLIKDQADGTENGIYDVQAAGAPSRASDYDADAEVIAGTCTLVTEGTANASKVFAQLTSAPVLGVDELVFSQVLAPSAYTASNGVKLVGADFQIDTSDTNPSLEVADGGLRAKVDDTSVQRTAGGLAIKAVDGSVLTGLPSTPSGAGKLPTVNLGTGTADNTRFLRGDQSWAEPPGGAGVVSINYTKALDTDIVPVTVFGTAAETTFHSYTVPAGTLGTDKIIRLTLAGTYRNNTNSNQVLGARLKYGGTILCSRISGSIGKDAGTGSFAFVFHLAAAGATDAQQGFLQCSIESGADVSVNWDDRGRSTIDSTAEQTLLITVWHSLGHSQLTITKLIAHAELLNASDTVGAPLDASYITIAANGSLTAERALTAGEGIDLTDGGANSTITIDGEDASDTNKGIVELATAAETTTGTDAGRAVTPDALAGSDYGKRIVEVKVIDDATHLATGDGKAIICIPAELNGWNLVAAHGFVTTPDAAAVATFQVRNVTDAVDMLSTPITIDATEYTSYTAAAPPVIDAAHDDVATGDLIAIDKDVAGTAEKGDGVILVFALP